MYLRYGDISWDSLDAAQTVESAVLTQQRRASRLQREAHQAQLPVVRLHGIQLHAVTEEGAIGHILDRLDMGQGGVVVTPNLDHLRRCVHDLRFAALVAEADLVVADGMPLVWASRLQGTPLPERVAGSDLLSSLSAAAAQRSRSIYLLGGSPGTAQGAAKVLKDRNSGLRICGAFCPPMGFERDETIIGEMMGRLRSSAADIVYVALGSPKQELLIERIRGALPNAWWLGVGNSFSFLCGDVRRAPIWMQRGGVEWMHRLLQEPKRLFKRYLVLGVPFAVSLLTRSTLKGIPKRLGKKTPADLPRLPAAAADSPPHPDQDGQTELDRQIPGSHNGENVIPVSIHHGRPGPTLPERALKNLRALVLLGGQVRPSSLSSATGRSVLDLPLDDNGSVLNHWLMHASDIARSAGLENLPVRILVDRHSPEPAGAVTRYGLGTVRVERDQSEYRGTGGVLADVGCEYAADDLILMCNAAQVLLDPLVMIMEMLRRTRGEVALVSHQDGTPSGVMLLSCGALRLLPRSGFVDMKEQGLASMARQFDVMVAHRRKPTGLPLRSLADYIQALRHYHRRRKGMNGLSDPLAEDWRATFAIVEAGAQVDAGARLHDSVVLSGAKVESGAVLVRSLVCAGGVVRRDRSVVDQIITAADAAKVK